MRSYKGFDLPYCSGSFRSRTGLNCSHSSGAYHSTISCADIPKCFGSSRRRLPGGSLGTHGDKSPTCVGQEDSWPLKEPRRPPVDPNPAVHDVRIGSRERERQSPPCLPRQVVFHGSHVFIYTPKCLSQVASTRGTAVRIILVNWKIHNQPLVYAKRRFSSPFSP